MELTWDALGIVAAIVDTHTRGLDRSVSDAAVEAIRDLHDEYGTSGLAVSLAEVTWVLVCALSDVTGKPPQECWSIVACHVSTHLARQDPQ